MAGLAASFILTTKDLGIIQELGLPVKQFQIIIMNSYILM